MVFPGLSSQAMSPNKDFLIENVDSQNEEDSDILGGNHALFLINILTGKRKHLHAYERHVEVWWSPTGSYVLVNDYRGSDSATPLIFMIDEDTTCIALEKELAQQAQNNSHIWKNHHVYITGSEWIAQDVLKVKIEGYGDVDPDGFTLWFEYHIGKGFTAL